MSDDPGEEFIGHRARRMDASPPKLNSTAQRFNFAVREDEEL
jgi:hypothetical protein